MRLINKISHVSIFATLPDTTANMGDAFCNFPLNDASGFLATRMKLREGAWGKDAPSFDGERCPLGVSLPLRFSMQRGSLFPIVSCC